MAADSLTIKRSHTYDSRGRPETMETSPSKLKVGYEYNARGYLSRLKRGTSALATRTAVDARSNATGTVYGNGVSTTSHPSRLGGDSPSLIECEWLMWGSSPTEIC